MESSEQRSQRILKELQTKYPNKETLDLTGQGTHFVCVLEPTSEHPEYDRAIEVIIKSHPHKHLKSTQKYTVISGILEVHDEDKVVVMNVGDTYTIPLNHVHWAKSDNEAWVEIYSTPGWSEEDHIVV